MVNKKEGITQRHEIYNSILEKSFGKKLNLPFLFVDKWYKQSN